MPTPLSAIPLPNHLGGSLGKTHTDYGVLRHFITQYQVKSFLDVGCGPGGMVDLAASYGLISVGVDGDYTLPQFSDAAHGQNGSYLLHDFTAGDVEFKAAHRLPFPIDLAWSVEFLEHIDAQYLPNVMAAFVLAKRIVVTAAPPGANGHHHVNCQPAPYWIELFQSYGLRYAPELTATIRRESTMVRSFIRNTGLVFCNEEYVDGTH